MNATKSTPKLVAMVSDWQKLRSIEGSFGNTPEIRVEIARLHEDGKPRNYRHEYDERGDTAGGFFARIWAYRPSEGEEGLSRLAQEAVEIAAKADPEFAGAWAETVE